MLLLVLKNALAQKTIYQTTGFWFKSDVNQILDNSKWGLGLDFVYRTKNELNQGSPFSSLLRKSFRPWVHYQISDKARLSISPLGYLYTNNYVGKPADFNQLPYHELRTTIQFVHHHKQLGGRVMHTWRYRYEMRWQEQFVPLSYRYVNRFRVRYSLRVGLNSSDISANRTLYATLSDEIGVNFGKNVVYNTFSQNRLYIGLGYRFLTAARIELRYFDRFGSRSTGFEFDNNRGIMLGLYIDQVTLFGTKDIIKVRYFD